MALTHQDTAVNQLIINKCTIEEYNAMPSHSGTELYIVPEQLDTVVTQGSTNPVQSGAVYDAIQNIGGTINDGTTIFAKNQEIIGTTSANQSANQTIKLPNDVMMCKMLENRALASYATPITRFKYIEDHGWVDMDRSDIQYNEGTGEWTGTFVSLDITEGEYYYDMDNEAVFVADENSEMQDVTSTVVIQDDINKLYCDVDTNMLYRYNGSNFITLTSNFSGDYNDLSNKPLSLESNKVKYTLSDGTTKLTLAQEKDVVYRKSYDYEFYKSDTYFGVVIADITDIITASSSDTGFEYRGFNGTVVFVRERGYIYDVTAMITCSISYKNNEIRLHTSNSSIRPQIRSSNNRYYLCIRSGANSAGTFYFYGYGKNLLSNFFAFSDNDYPLIQDCRNIVNESVIQFPSDDVSGNIASGETLAVMMKKINIALGMVNISNNDWTFTAYIRDSNLYGILNKTLGILMISGWFRVVNTDIPRYSKLFKLKGYSGFPCYPLFATEELTNGERHTLRTRTGESGYDGYFLFVNRTSTSNSIYFEGLPTVLVVGKD